MKLEILFLVLVVIFQFSAAEDVQKIEEKTKMKSRTVKEPEKEGRAVPKEKLFPNLAQVWAEKKNTDFLKTNSNFRKDNPMNRQIAPTTKPDEQDDINKIQEVPKTMNRNSMYPWGSYQNSYYYCYALCQNGFSYYDDNYDYNGYYYPPYYNNYPPYYYDYSPYY